MLELINLRRKKWKDLDPAQQRELRASTQLVNYMSALFAASSLIKFIQLFFFFPVPFVIQALVDWIYLAIFQLIFSPIALLLALFGVNFWSIASLP